MKVVIETAGLSRLAAKSESRRKALQDSPEMRAALQTFGKKMIEQMQRNAASFNPGPVPDLTPAYKKRKLAEVGYAYPILFKTGAMLSSAYSRIFKPGTVNARAWVVRLGFAGMHPLAKLSNAELVRIHTRGEGNNPKRDFTKIPRAVESKLFKPVLDVVRKIRTAKRR